MSGTSGLYTAEFFKESLAPSYQSAKRIAPLISRLLPVRSVLDVGCGTGHFLKAFQELGVSDLMGLDGDHVPQDQLVIAPSVFHAVDLAAEFNLKRQFDVVLSLEVAEHLPPTAADSFVGSLVQHGSGIIFSAAIPHQGGTAHINERWPSYWAEKFARHGYEVYDVLRPLIWHDEQVAWWYRQNILVFADARARSDYPSLARLAPTRTTMLDYIHPQNYLSKAAMCDRLQELQNLLASGSMFEVTHSVDGQLVIKRCW